MITLVSPSKCIEQVLSLLFGIPHMQFDEDHETVRELLVHLIERIYFEKGVRPASDPQNVLHYFLFNFTNYTKDSPDYKQFLADAESYAFIRGVETTDHFVNSFFLFLRCHFSQEELDKCFPKVPVRCVLIKHDLDIRLKDHSLISIENLSLIELPKSKVKNKETKVEKTKKESEKKEMAGPVNNTPAKRGTGRATAAKALQAGKHALAVNLATTGADALVVATRKALGTHYPDFLNTPLGKALEPWLVAVLLHFAASEFPQMPGADKVQAIAGLAIEGGTNRMMDPLFQMLRPVFESVANLPEAKSLVIDVAQAVQPEA